MKPECTECGEPRSDNNFVPTKNLCRRCDKVFSGSRSAYKVLSGGGRRSWPVTVRKIVDSIMKRVTLGESTDEMIEWLRRKYNMTAKDAVSVVADVWCNTEEGRNRRKQVLPSENRKGHLIMLRLRELWETHHSSNGTKRANRRNNDIIVQSFFGKPERYRNGRRVISGWEKKIPVVESRRRVRDSGA